jgi:selenocysteine-specific elongation factor
VVLLDREELEPGSVVYAQIVLEEQAVPVKGDRFVIRSYSPMRTIGGGIVIDPLPKRKHKRFRDEVISALATRERGTPAEIVQQYLEVNNSLFLPADVAAATGLQEEEVLEAAGVLAKENIIKLISGEGKSYLISINVYSLWQDNVKKLLSACHRDFPLRDGFPKEELRSRKFPSISNKIFQLLLLEMEKEGVLKLLAQAVALKDFEPGPDAEQKIQIQQIRHILQEAAYLPPSWPDLSRTMGFDEVKGTC